MPGDASKSPEWADAYSKATRSAALPSEKEMVRLLALPIPANDRVGIGNRVKDFHRLVAAAPVGDLKLIEAKLGDDKSGLSRLYKLELSTSLRNDLLSRMRSRVGRNDAGLNSAGRGLGPPSPTQRVPKERLNKAVAIPKARQPGPDDYALQVGPINISAPEPDGAGHHFMTISGTIADRIAATRVIADHLAKELKKHNASALVEAMQLPDSTGQIQPTIRVSNVGGGELWGALWGVRNRYENELSANTISQEEYDEIQGWKKFSEAWQKFGNIYNPVPFTEYTDQGLEFTGFNPLDALSVLKGVKDIRRPGGQGKIVRRALGGLAAANPKKVLALLKKGIDGNAWQKAIGQLSAADKALLNQLSQAEGQVLRAINLGQTQRAYNLVKKWREPARKLYEKVRDLYWQDPKVRKQWEDAGADMSKNAPTLLIEQIGNGRKKVYKPQTVTLEHTTRVNDNPFLAVLEKNLVKSFSYENSVLLEDIRRIERGRNTNWSSSPIELFVKTIELKIK